MKLTQIEKDQYSFEAFTRNETHYRGVIIGDDGECVFAFAALPNHPEPTQDQIESALMSSTATAPARWSWSFGRYFTAGTA